VWFEKEFVLAVDDGGCGGDGSEINVVIQPGSK
jgi:hypothetical protein